MSLSTETKTQNTTTVSADARSFFSSWKSGAAFGDGTSGLFASLLAEAGSSFAKEKASEAPTSAVAAQRTPESVKAQSTQPMSKETAANRTKDDGFQQKTSSSQEEERVSERPAQETKKEKAEEEVPDVKEEETAAAATQGVASQETKKTDENSSLEEMETEGVSFTEEEPIIPALSQEEGAKAEELVAPPPVALEDSGCKEEKIKETAESHEEGTAKEESLAEEVAAFVGLYAPLGEEKKALGLEKKASSEEKTETRAQADDGALTKGKESSLSGALESLASDADENEGDLAQNADKSFSQKTPLSNEKTTLSFDQDGANEAEDFQNFFARSAQANAVANQNQQTGANATALAAGAAVQSAELASSATAQAAASSSSASSSPIEGAGRMGSQYLFTSQLSSTPSAAKTAQAASSPVVEQVTVQFHKMVKAGKDEMTINLHPADLGKIEVKLSFGDDHKVHATIVADKATTLDLLQKDSAALQRALQDAGLQADAGSLDFSLRGDERQDSLAQNQSEAHAKNRGSESSISIGSEAESLSGVEEETYYIMPGRVNLRV